MKDKYVRKIKESCEYVSLNSEYVSINYKELDNFIKTIYLNKVTFWLSSNPYGLFDMEIDKIINFMLIYDSINLEILNGLPISIIKNCEKYC